MSELLDDISVTGAVKAVSVAPNSCFIASASYDKTVGLWLTREARCLYMLTCKPFHFLVKHKPILNQLSGRYQYHEIDLNTVDFIV